MATRRPIATVAHRRPECLSRLYGGGFVTGGPPHGSRWGSCVMGVTSEVFGSEPQRPAVFWVPVARPAGKRVSVDALRENHSTRQLSMSQRGGGSGPLWPIDSRYGRCGPRSIQARKALPKYRETALRFWIPLRQVHEHRKPPHPSGQLRPRRERPLAAAPPSSAASRTRRR